MAAGAIAGAALQILGNANTKRTGNTSSIFGINPYGTWLDENGERRDEPEILRNFLDPFRLGGLFDKSEEESNPFLTQDIVDPLKQSTATQLQKYLSGEIGQGLPLYQGKLSPDYLPAYNSPTSNYYTPEDQAATELDEAAINRYNEFLNLDAGEWFDKAVANPAIKDYQENVLPELREGYAGSLRGSGRFYSEEESMNEFSLGLAQQRAEAERTIPQEQFALAAQKFGLESDEAAKVWEREATKAGLSQEQAKIELDKAKASFEAGTTQYALVDAALDKQYQNWFTSLAQNNPALQQALTFLNEGTSTGTTTLSALESDSGSLLGNIGSIVSGLFS